MTAPDAMLGLTMRFVVTIDGVDLASWSKAGGLEVSWDYVEYRAGDAPNYTWMFPGNAKFKKVLLERGADKESSAKVRDWLNNTSFKHAPKSGKIELQDAHLETVCEWSLVNVLPVSWKIVPFDADGNKVAIESLELAHGGFLQEAK